MAVENINSYNKYQGNGVATEFSVDFKYNSKNDVTVYLKREGAIQQETLEVNVDYEWLNDTTIRFPAILTRTVIVEGVETTETYTNQNILDVGDILAIYRETPVSSDYNFANQRRLFPEEVTKSDDLGIMLIQELHAMISRALILDETSTVTPLELVEELQTLVIQASGYATTAEQARDQAVAVINNPDFIAVAGSLTDISSVASDLTNINSLVADLTNIDAVANNISNVNTVANDATNINTVATNITNVNNCSTNMTVIQDAPTQAANAASSALSAANSAQEAQTAASMAKTNLPLLFHFWHDKIINEVCFLRADTFSWQSGKVYIAVYQHLTDDIEGKTLQSETIAGITIQYYLADDGDKICPASEETNILNLYNSIGVAWYYILDTVNQRFKLPRTKWGFTGLRDAVGKYVEANVNYSHYHALGYNNNNNAGSFIATNNTGVQVDLPLVNNTTGYRGWNGSGSGGGFTQSSAKYTANMITSDSINLDNTKTVQPPATQMYLYFYVGNFTQTALENTAGLHTEEFNNKADVGLNNVSTTSGFRRLVEVYNNGTDWYKIFEEYNAVDGTYIGKWCEQGGTITSNASSLVINLLVPYLSKDYNFNVHARANDDDTGGYGDAIAEVTGSAPYDYGLKVDSFRLSTYSRSLKICWDTKGYIS